MGQKVHPIGFRLGQHYTWSSKWFANNADYKKLLAEDFVIRKFLDSRLKTAGLSKVEIERLADRRLVKIHVSRPGVVIGRGGSGLEELKKALVSRLKIEPEKIELQVFEVSDPDLDATLIAKFAADQLERRMPARRVVNQLVERVTRAGAKGVKVTLAGRIGGSSIARRESVKAGTIPLQTLRANIDFAKTTALTKSGTVGVKVWICRP